MLLRVLAPRLCADFFLTGEFPQALIIYLERDREGVTGWYLGLSSRYAILSRSFEDTHQEVEYLLKEAFCFVTVHNVRAAFDRRSDA